MVLFGKSARKKRKPPLRVTLKFWSPPPSESLSKMGTSPQGAFSGQQGQREIKGGGVIARKGYFAVFCFFFCVCKKWIPLPPQSLRKILESIFHNFPTSDMIGLIQYITYWSADLGRGGGQTYMCVPLQLYLWSIDVSIVEILLSPPPCLVPVPLPIDCQRV